MHKGTPIDPDRKDEASADDAEERALSKMIRKHFPGLEDQPSIQDTCIYTVR